MTELENTRSCNDRRNAPIGVFDSGYGGLTVLRELVSLMPEEEYIFLGDSSRCPYGPRDLSEVKGFVLQICSYLKEQGCKLIVIACNTATAAGLKAAQLHFDVPIVGVVEPGARAAVHMTRNRRVGVIATQGTIDSCAYADAIHNLDAGIKVFSVPTPRFVEIAEAGLQFIRSNYESYEGIEGLPSYAVIDRGVIDLDSWQVYERIAKDYLEPLRKDGIDTLVMGCTHFPLIEPLIQEGIGEEVRLVSSAQETALEVLEVLKRRGELHDIRANNDFGKPQRRYVTTGPDVGEFQRFGAQVMGISIEASRVELEN